MEQQVNGKLGDWAARCLKARPIPVATKTSCLELFKAGIGYHKAARTLDLRPYTVRDWLRRHKAGDDAWATRDGRKSAPCPEAKDLIEYRHEIKETITGPGTDAARDGSGIDSERPFRRSEDQVAGGAEHASAIPLYGADEACVRILDGSSRKKKEVDSVRSLVEAGHAINEACRVAGLPRCSYYRARRPSAKAESDAALVRLMCEIENDGHISSTYGVDRLTGEVNNRLPGLDPEVREKILCGGQRVNRKRVHRLMKESGIHSRIRRRKHPDNYYKEAEEALKKNRAPNILNRSFASERPMAKLTTDVTYIPCSDRKFVYLSPLFDLFNHEIVSHAVSTVNSEEFVLRMLAALPPEALRGALVHNDQGPLYWANDWVSRCEELQIVRSMSRRGNCWDNALSENFFSALKADLGLTKQGYRTLLTAKEVEALIADYIPWYNTGRIQKKLGYMSPVQYRKAFLDGALPAKGVAPAPAGSGPIVLLNGATGSRLGPSARPFGDGASPSLRSTPPLMPHQ